MADAIPPMADSMLRRAQIPYRFADSIQPAADLKLAWFILRGVICPLSS